MATKRDPFSLGLIGDASGRDEKCGLFVPQLLILCCTGPWTDPHTSSNHIFVCSSAPVLPQQDILKDPGPNVYTEDSHVFQLKRDLLQAIAASCVKNHPKEGH